MKYRTLGKTGLKVSVIGIGAWQLGGEWGKDFSQDEVDQTFARARDLGINLIDTAECYGDHLSESLIGKAIQKNRKDWIIATKFGHQFAGHLKRKQLWSPKEVTKQLEASLKALQTDYIDIYQFHSGTDEELNQDELWSYLHTQVKAGKIRFLGNSISRDILFNKDPSFQIEYSNKVGVQILQVIYNRLDRKVEENVFPLSQKYQLGVLARIPLDSGYLSGKYQAGAKFDTKDVRATYDKEKTQEKLKQVEEIRKNEVPKGVEMAQWALAWCLKNPQVSAVIPGCKNVEQVESNAKAADLLNK